MRLRRGPGWTLAVVGVAVSLAAGVPAHVAQAEASSPRTANYTIQASYDADTHTVTGHEVLTWHNTTSEAATDLYFHLYLNAFANNRSSFVREAGEMWADWLKLHPHGWGYVAIKALRIGGADLVDRMRFVHPDDDNIDDRTVVRVPLEQPVPSGEAVEVEVDFVAKLPKVVARSGYAGPFAFVAQWFPKIGVYEDGHWNCHQYHLTTEFFADFGVYDVTLTVPRNGVVGATGVLRDSHEDGATKTLHFVAEDVHDFAWAVDPRFQVVERAAGGTAIRVLVQPRHLAQTDRYLQAAQSALDWYQRSIGRYPYPQLTVVDPGPGGGGAGGMEYPTLITTGTAWWMPPKVRLPEFVTVHEFGHQYWYGMVANNEAEEAWLDEGINSYVEGRIMDAVGPGSYIDLFGLRFDSAAIRRLQYVRAPQHDAITRRAWEFLDRSSYGAISYSKTALMLDTLEAYVGEETLRQALAAYFERWRFRHPRAEDFLASMNESVGQDLSWYFDQVLPGTGVVDYAVTQVNADKLHGSAGYTLSGAVVGEEALPQTPQEQQYHNEVVVERLGSVSLPVDVHITFDDGGVTKEHWDGQGRWKRFEYTGKQRVEWAVVDVLPLDVNVLNNSRMRAAGTRGIVRIAGRWGFWFQNLMYLLTGL
ncbi:MAG: M1 family metallopeptidase [Candidatus Binatia bacterium]